MKVSVGFPTGMEGLTYPIPFGDPRQIVDLARHAETLGYDSVWGNDHLTTQHYVRREFKDPPRYWDQFVVYSFVAAATRKLRFGTSMLVLPMRRDIVVVAKQIATLDQFSGGRLEIGLGVGAYREEFEAVQPGFKAHRGEMVEEGVQALRRLLTERTASFDGTYYKYRDVELFPKPLQAPFKLHIGGNNENAVRRAALHGDGWIPACLAVDRFERDVERLRELATRAGRDPARIEIAPQFIAHVGRTHEEAVARFRRSQMLQHLVSLERTTLREQGGRRHEEVNLIGDPAEVIAKARALRDAGATHLLGLYFAANDVSELRDQMQFFAEAVTPHIA